MWDGSISLTSPAPQPGCLLLVPLLNNFGAVNAVLAIAALAAVASVVASRQLLGVAATVILAAFFAFNLATSSLDVRWAKGAETRDVLFSKWNSFSHVTVHGDLEALNVLRIAIDADADTFVIWNSVLGSVGALALAILTGFSRVLAFGAMIYLAALLAVRRMSQPSG